MKFKKGSRLAPNKEGIPNKNLTSNCLNKETTRQHVVTKQHEKLLFQYVKLKINILYIWGFFCTDLNNLQL